MSRRLRLAASAVLAAIVLMLVLVPGLLRNLPQAALAAVVIAASLSLANIAGARRLWHQRIRSSRAARAESGSPWDDRATSRSTSTARTPAISAWCCSAAATAAASAWLDARTTSFMFRTSDSFGWGELS